MLKRFCLPVFICIAFSLTSCKTDSKKTSTDSSRSESEQAFTLKADRFEVDLFSIPFDSVETRIPELQTKYGPFLDIFTNRIINIGNRTHPDFTKNLKSFITDRYMYLTYQEVMKVYPKIDAEIYEMEEAFAKYNELFPKKNIPHVYTLISGYNQSVVTADKILGVSLDKYLGENCEYYSNLGLPYYQRRLMSKEYLASDALRGWCYSEFLFNDSAENVLTNILYEGKIIYLMKELFPEKHDSIILGFSKEHLKWSENNLNEMWTFMVERKMLFSTDYMTINKLINPAPFTALFNSESPGRAAVWLGYKIIESYMKNNDVTIPQLLADENYQGILERSKFNPK